MKREMELRLQAWVDSEPLGDQEVRACERLAAGDPGARQLVAELRALRAAMEDAELPRVLPETREFYWSKIQRAIDGVERAAAPAHRSAGWWQRVLRLLIPAGVVATLAVIVLLPMIHKPVEVNYGRAEIDSPLDDISGFSFRSDADGMNIVWVGTE